MVTGVNNLLCEVSEMDRACAFYRDTLGLTPGYQSPHWSDFKAGDLKIGLHPPFGTAAGGPGGWVVCLRVDDIAAFRSKLESAGVKCDPYHDTPSGAIFDFSDPDGNRFQAMQPGRMSADLA